MADKMLSSSSSLKVTIIFVIMALVVCCSEFVRIEVMLKEQSSKMKHLEDELTSAHNNMNLKQNDKHRRDKRENRLPRSVLPVTLKDVNRRNKRLKSQILKMVDQKIKQAITTIQGSSGRPGKAGKIGPPGPKGKTGRGGKLGPRGSKGDLGPKGNAGPRGPRGIAGPKGDLGPRGIAGRKGKTDSKTIQGPKGDQGSRGIAGPKGDAGRMGQQGHRGAKGDLGPKGNPGRRGIAGPKGAPGSRGIAGTGRKGIQGSRGRRGPRGPRGRIGWTGPNGVPGPRGLPGPKGAKQQPKDCLAIYRMGERMNGVYSVDPDDQGAFKVYCDMTTDGGGWTVFQRRKDGSVDFYRDWQQYKSGFGNLFGEFWLGNDYIHRLSASRPSSLRVELEDWQGNTRYAKYGSFNLGDESHKYKLRIGWYSGTAGDSLADHNDRSFTTKDRDNDLDRNSNCAVLFTGAWWYVHCHSSNLNGQYLGNKYNNQGARWGLFRDSLSLKKTEMKLRSN